MIDIAEKLTHECLSFPKRKRCLLLRIRASRIAGMAKCSFLSTETCLKSWQFQKKVSNSDLSDRRMARAAVRKLFQQERQKERQKFYTPMVSGTLGSTVPFWKRPK